MSSPTRAELTQHVFEVVRDQILGGASDFTPQTNLVDAGVDSLALTQILLSIEERTGFWLDESRLTPESLRSAEALASLVFDALASG
jgi:acyl carrier protein